MTPGTRGKASALSPQWQSHDAQDANGSDTGEDSSHEAHPTGLQGATKLNGSGHRHLRPRKEVRKLRTGKSVNERTELLSRSYDRQRGSLSPHLSDAGGSDIERPSTPLMMQRYLSHEIASEDLEYTLAVPSSGTSDVGSIPSTPKLDLVDIHEVGSAAHDRPRPGRPRKDTVGPDALNAPTFVATERGRKPFPEMTLRSRVKLLFTQTIANLISTGFLIFIVTWALTSRFIGALPTLLTLGLFREKRDTRIWDDPKKWQTEDVVKDIGYYARNCGYDIEDQVVVTKDGYLLRVHRVIVPHRKDKLHSDGRGGFPVIIQHGLFQSAGSFVTSEERSLAFWLAEHGGYQVYLTNNRGVFDMGHVKLQRNDPRFWDYNIRELAMYDLPAVVDHVLAETGYDQLAFIGHSQGNATMFCSLARGMVPQIGDKLSVFIALAPAVYAGPLTTGFPFGALVNMPWKTWKRIFGTLDFIPLMRWSYDYVPSMPFSLLGYQMFAFLFNWTDANWLQRRKPKMFRFTPSPVSSAGVFWWTGLGGFSSRGCVLNVKAKRWFDERFPPLSLYHGGHDYLVLCDPLLDRIRDHEPYVNLLRVNRLATGEHCDSFWGIDAVETTYGDILEDIERTRGPYPEELALT
ncbi:uncharacterized protein L969DRAFT_59842 [Mixia osmundae IAM 14324]|uniref:Partial AB-hydrolase lipase domain-containing protein n=1 Tax=Mixia osmundae (strain CBS 9802 / IAM 14324 / JCM 22182 / KY 12970) TaxID=764103 RepID=G7E5A4_MIXOS|nr:uncharacterized protein L969DRAFT_59842 [Mixia osmundae IAM 14324]KEI40837.1 hypothetical protein L969DRAFT_59842 [Mixia osmundae IAM 14324]GAA98014.1 hypothetical protein E5Q_04694 [Mixia osmundae IAM 14324]